jgi:uncharacterized protein
MMNSVAIEGALFMAVGLAGFGFGYHQGGLAARLAANTEHAQQLYKLDQEYAARDAAAQKRDAAYEMEITQLGVQQLHIPDIAVRLCPSPPAAAALPAAGSRGQVVPANAGVLPAVAVTNSPGPDVGPALFSLADYADEIVAKCRSD